MKLTVKEYATSLNVSIQSVYKKIKRGSLTTVKENNITYVVVDRLEVEEVAKPIQSNNCTELLDIIRRRDKEVKQLHKEIKRLTKSLEKCSKTKENVFLQYINELQQLQITHNNNASLSSDDIIEVEPDKKRKKKKNRKKKKGKK